MRNREFADSDDRVRVGPVLGALVAAGFVVMAVGVEVVSGRYANSQVPAWAYRVSPLAWPQPARVAWWLAVAGAMVVFRLLLARAGFPQRPLVVALSAAPFLIFAAGVTIGADWATWH